MCIVPVKIKLNKKNKHHAVKIKLDSGIKRPWLGLGKHNHLGWSFAVSTGGKKKHPHLLNTYGVCKKLWGLDR